MAEPTLQLTTRDRLCPRCCLPEDLLPIQQAIVLRSFPPAFAALLDCKEVDGPRSRPPSPDVWFPLEHISYVGAMLGVVYIRLRQLLDRELPEPIGLVIGRRGDAGNTEVHAAFDRLGDQAERLSQTIVSGAHGRDWRARSSQDGPSPHALIHLAIDEATEHLRDAQRAVLPDPSTSADEPPGLLLDGRTVPGGTPDLAALPPRRRETGGHIVRARRTPVR